MLPKTLDKLKSPKVRPIVTDRDGNSVWGPIYWYIDKPIGILQFITGLITLYVGASYTADIAFTGRPLNPLMLITLFVAGIHNFSQATRNWAWAMIVGVAGGSIGGYGIWALKASLAPDGSAPPWFAVIAIMFFAVYWGLWVLTKPYEEMYAKVGEGMAWGGAAIPSGIFQIFVAILAAPWLGVMVV